uniref:Uncharacterized protein n=1 Tax=Rhizophora mucronata TaxID=61149 RepID=A0A2P2QBY2_RHIMU
MAPPLPHSSAFPQNYPQQQHYPPPPPPRPAHQQYPYQPPLPPPTPESSYPPSPPPPVPQQPQQVCSSNHLPCTTDLHSILSMLISHCRHLHFLHPRLALPYHLHPHHPAPPPSPLSTTTFQGER